MQEHTTNLELSQEMKSLGFPQKSLVQHVYEWDINDSRTGNICVETITVIEHYEMKRNIICSAYLSSELAAFHPDDMLMNKSTVTNQDKMAKMLIRLAKEGIITPKAL